MPLWLHALASIALPALWSALCAGAIRSWDRHKARPPADYSI